GAGGRGSQTIPGIPQASSAQGLRLRRGLPVLEETCQTRGAVVLEPRIAPEWRLPRHGAEPPGSGSIERVRLDAPERAAARIVPEHLCGSCPPQQPRRACDADHVIDE